MPLGGSAVVLDTNIAVLLMSGDQAIRRRVAETDTIVVSTIVLGELFYGAGLSSRLIENTQRVEEFASSSEVCEVTIETSRHYASIKCALRRNGTPIPNNDIWIAALPQQFDASVATRDHHFRHVTGLRISDW
jgi:tRNA(fMet)-specific endonuclease VapC